MSAVELVRAAGLAAHVPYAYGSRVPAGTELVFLAGSCPLDADGVTVAPGDIPAQAAQCLENLRVALAAVDATLDDVASTRVLVASVAQPDLVAAWNVVAEAFGEHDVPSTLLGVAALGWPDQLVEIEAVAALTSRER